MSGAAKREIESPTDMLIRGALRLGISAADLELFTIGSLLDVLLYEPTTEAPEIEATQADFDAF